MKEVLKWIPKRINQENGKIRLVCFPWAGGGASYFLKFFQNIHPNIEVCPVQLPGRENFYSKKPYTEIQVLCRDFIKDLEGFLVEKKLSFFGHSMGGMISFEIVKKLEEISIPIDNLIVSGSCPPTYFKKKKVLSTKDILIENGTDAEIIRNKELFEIYSSILFKDLELINSMTNKEKDKKIHTNLSILHGFDDNSIPIDSLNGWCDLVDTIKAKIFYEGGHMFIRSNKNSVIKVIEDILLLEEVQ